MCELQVCELQVCELPRIRCVCGGVGGQVQGLLPFIGDILLTAAQAGG